MKTLLSIFYQKRRTIVIIFTLLWMIFSIFWISRKYTSSRILLPVKSTRRSYVVRRVLTDDHKYLQKIKDNVKNPKEILELRNVIFINDKFRNYNIESEKICAPEMVEFLDGQISEVKKITTPFVRTRAERKRYYRVANELFGGASPVMPELNRQNYREKFYIDQNHIFPHNRENELRFLNVSLLQYEDEYEKVMPSEMFYKTGQTLLYMLMRHFKPRKFLEIGSGASTYAANKACVKNRKEGYPCEIICVEPYRYKLVEGKYNNTVLIKKELEDSLEDIEGIELGTNDFLFIDSSHVVYPFNDVVLEMLFLVPKLASGVIVQVHDIYLPKGLWQCYSHRHFTEQLFLAGLLYGSSKWEPIFTGGGMIKDVDKYRVGSIYFQRK